VNNLALVTGGAGAIGSAICRALASAGYTVIVNYNTSETAARTLASELGGIAVRADVSDSKQVLELFRQIEELGGTLSVVVNNAAIAQYGLFQLTTDEERARVIAVNLLGAMNVAASAVPLMLARKAGTIINISSIWGETGASCEVIYSASKAGLIGFSKALEQELEPSNIRVRYITPGAINAGMSARFTEEDLEGLEIKQPEDVAEAVMLQVADNR
jgi:3-oxoacyl-[acyl-carrier protein] reductase